jgi:hypothetical protein
MFEGLSHFAGFKFAADLKRRNIAAATFARTYFEFPLVNSSSLSGSP